MKYLYGMRPPKKEKSIFSKQVITLRIAKGMTQKQLAAALGVSINTIAYYEADAANPSAELIRKLADFFGVEPGLLLGGNRQKKSPGPTSKLQKQIEHLQRLPKTTQKIVSEMIDGVLKTAVL